MRGILSAAGYVPYRRLQRSDVAAFFGSGGGRGTRAVAGHDEDSTTMGVEAARAALASTPAAAVDAVWFATTAPAYLDKTNATAIHAALRLPADAAAADFGGALRSGVQALRATLEGAGTTLVVSADVRDGLPTSVDEAAGGDAAAAMVIGEGSEATPVIAELAGAASATIEMVDRWRAPGARRSKVWEERFGEGRYVEMGRDAYARALKAAGVAAEQVDRVAVTGMHARAVKALVGKLRLADGVAVDDLSATVGQSGAAHPGLLLAAVLEEEAARPEAAQGGRTLVVLHLADGADALVLRTTPAIARFTPTRPVLAQVANSGPLPYAKFLSWRGMVEPEPPRRPEPQRVSTPAAWRSEEWKFAFVGSKDRSSGAVHLPPARISMQGGAVDDMEPEAMAGRQGTVVTFTVDRMIYSPSPPVLFAVVDFDGGGRFPVELTDIEPEELAIGDRVEMTFRRLFSVDDIHDYFWKARPVRNRAAGQGEEASP